MPPENLILHLTTMGDFQLRLLGTPSQGVENPRRSDGRLDGAADGSDIGHLRLFTIRTIVDVGGGNGAFLAAILRKHPKLTGRFADLPHVVSLAASVLQRAGVANRCEVIGCSFFEAVPSGGDAYVLKSVIHDWDDARALTILRNCHRAMDAPATLLTFDRVPPQQPAPEAAMRYLVDLGMLVCSPVAGNEQK